MITTKEREEDSHHDQAGGVVVVGLRLDQLAIDNEARGEAAAVSTDDDLVADDYFGIVVEVDDRSVVEHDSVGVGVAGQLRLIEGRRHDADLLARLLG